IVQICLWIIDLGCSKHMTGNRALLTNFVEKFLETVRFGNNDFAVIAGYGDVVIGSVSKMPFRKKPRDSMNVCSKSNSNKSLPRTVHKLLPKLQPLAELVAK
nr:integrase, catalytic region, zinc finger, CCHC-type, peptidase aspartic, catalytic [Tanacetum cinerariifolium]